MMSGKNVILTCRRLSGFEEFKVDRADLGIRSQDNDLNNILIDPLDEDQYAEI